MDYSSFVTSKLTAPPATGIEGPVSVPESLFPHQKALVFWAIKRGRAAIFADTGLGKSRMQIAWADAVCKHTGMPVLVLAPLAVAQQTAEEAQSIGIDAVHVRDGSDVVNEPRIFITNYDRLHRFDPSMFGGVVLDESSCIKHHDTKTLKTLLEAFRGTRFKLCATATPAPNDWTELGTHAEFLGVCTRQEMLAEFFTHDGGDTSVWRLKGHARSIFWRWVCQWGALVRRPSDLGFDGSAYALPPLHLHEHTVETELSHDGMLFASEAQTLSERRAARRLSLADRVAECASAIYGDWYKMAALNQQGECHGVEEGVRGSETSEGRSGPGVQGEAKCSIDERQGGAGAVHGCLLQGEPGEVQADAGATGQVQRVPQEEVQGVCRVQGGGKISGEGLAGGKPTQAKVSATEEVRADDSGVQRADGVSVGRVRDLRPLGHVNAELLPGCGPLPLIGEGSRASVHGLQSGAWQVQGRYGPASLGSFVPQEPWLIWCELNDEQDALERAFGNLAFSVRGSDTADKKEALIRSWLARERPVMISKPSIMGFGLNFQHCARMAFVGVTDSFEAYYQAVRRCWRFGQKRDVHVHIFSSTAEGAVVANLKRKERDAMEMAESLSAETRDTVIQSVTGTSRQTNAYNASTPISIPSFF